MLFSSNKANVSLTMSELESSPFECSGSTFGMESVMMNAVVDGYVGDDILAEADELVNELNDENPYTLLPIVFRTQSPMKLVHHQLEGEVLTLDPGEIEARFDGFFVIDEIGADNHHYPQLGAKLIFDEGEYKGYFGRIEAESIFDIRLQSSFHPFVGEEGLFTASMDSYFENLHKIPGATKEDFIEFLLDQVNHKSSLRGCGVQLLICDVSEVSLRQVEMGPDWIPVSGDPDSELEIVEEPVDYRGCIEGEVIAFDCDYEEDDNPDLTVVLALPPNESLIDDTRFNVACIRVSDISQGRIVSGPILN